MQRIGWPAIIGFVALLAHMVPAQAEVVARVSLAQQRMTVTVDGKPTYTWPVSTGREGFETPTGTYTPTWLDKDHRSEKYDDAPMPYSVFFRGGYAVHGTMALGMLGRRASHGCVRLSTANARTFYALVEQRGKSATRIVLEHGGPAVASARPGTGAASGARSASAAPSHSSPSQGALRLTAARVTRPQAYVYQIGPDGQLVPVAMVHYGHRSR